MRNSKGFTLTELMVVVGLSVLLLAWGLPAFSSWKNKHDVENQVLKLYSDLQLARMTAYSRKVVAGVWWGGGTSLGSYQVRTDGNGDGDVDDTGTDPQMGAAVNGSLTASASQPSVAFDGRGFLDIDTTHPAGSLVFSVPSSAGVSIDCVDVSGTRIIVGKMNGGTCSPK